jgi:hypothetical protein
MLRFGLGIISGNASARMSNTKLIPYTHPKINPKHANMLSLSRLHCRIYFYISMSVSKGFIYTLTTGAGFALATTG